MRTKINVFALIILTVVIALALPAAGQQVCGSVYEYCQAGCEELAHVGSASSYRAEDFSSIGAAFDRLLELDIERVTFAIVQPRSNQSAFVLVYRARWDAPPSTSTWTLEIRYTADQAAALRTAQVGNDALSVELNSGVYVVAYRPPCDNGRRRPVAGR